MFKTKTQTLLVQIVDTSDGILAVCNDVNRRGPKTFVPYSPYSGQRVHRIVVRIPPNADWQDFSNLRWLLAHPRKQVLLSYTPKDVHAN
jgi:hypothetical protein